MELTYKQAAAWFKRKEQSLRNGIPRAEEQNLKDNVSVAKKLSLGPISTVELIILGHPYARRAPNPPQSAFIINYQKGIFYLSWTYYPPVWSQSGDLVSELVNTAPYANFMRGTRLMIERPIYDEVVNLTEVKRFKRLDNLVTRTLTPK